MRLHRFIGNFNLKTGEMKIEDRDFFNQARNVLKLKVGEKLILGDGNKNEGTAEITEYGKGFIKVNVVNIEVNQNESAAKVILYCSILKKENFELVVQKATEIGVVEIVPLITSRTIKLDIRKDRLEKIIREAAEQSGRGMIPVLREPLELKDAMETAKSHSDNMLFDLSGESLEQAKRLSNQDPVGIWIGPEGGWSPEEIESAGKMDFKIINLGKTTLRGETAAIVAAYLAIHNL